MLSRFLLSCNAGKGADGAFPVLCLVALWIRLARRR
ncbi:hypothetical protein FEM01_14165 [Pseudomonas mosselii]|uniref:Uncharacterized protein n=1 Tax=Pseudomonas mosselii TaxID=78327 RepID=A0A5R8Z0H2_9PSED|nr:hypothetical protein FEM01_14165 [Pseudomonas mosselii]